MGKAPVEIAGQQCQRLQQHIVTLLLHSTTNTEDKSGIRGFRTLARRMFAGKGTETIEIEAVMT